MGEIADSLINGDFDFYTGEYIGRGYGIPRTRNSSLSWERKNKDHKKDFLSSKEVAYNGVKNYIVQRWNGRQDTPSIRSLVYEYLGQTNVDLKQKCIDIQKDFKAFIKFIDLKVKP